MVKENEEINTTASSFKSTSGSEYDLINIKAYTTGIISPWMEAGTHFENTLRRRVTICDALKDLHVLMPRLDNGIYCRER